MKKVLVIETLSQINGGQKMSLMVADMLRGNGKYEIIWVIPEKGILSAKLEQNNYRYYLLGDLSMPAGVKAKSVIFKYGKMTVASIAKLISIIKREKIDIIYAPGPAALPWSAICGNLLKKPVVWHLHHNFTDGPTKKLINLCSEFTSVKKIIAVSNTVGSQIKRTNKVQVLFNPVNFEKYSSGIKKNVGYERPFNLKSHILCQVALLEDDKNQVMTINILSCLKKMGEDFVGVFVGTTKPGDERYLDKLTGIAKELGIMDKCYFLGYRNDVPDLLKASDIAIIPSLEGFPLAGLEACAAGVPILACNVAGAAELVEQGKCGVKYRFDDPQDGANNVLQCMEQKESFSKQGVYFASRCRESDFMKKIVSIFGEF